MSEERWLSGLNPEQKQAVLHNQGPALILAGAGSGKTTVLVHRTGRLIEEKICRSEEILLLTFTNKAARELMERVKLKLEKTSATIWAGTFHGFGLQVLKKYHEHLELPKKFGIIDQSDSKSILKELLRYNKIDTKDQFDLDTLLSCISCIRQHKSLPLAHKDYHEMASHVTPKYLERMKALGVVDFDGLLLLPLSLLVEHQEVLDAYQSQFSYFMVDEFQDTNDLQMQLIQKLSSKSDNLTVVGDDDQAIYGWRGAQISHILDFPKHFKPCKVIHLERNYRSQKAILDFANYIIQKNSSRFHKTLKSQNKKRKEVKPELFVYENEEEEANSILSHLQYFKDLGYEYKNLCILYRSNTQSNIVEALFRKEKIPYKVTGGTGFFDRKEIKDVLAFLLSSFRPNEISFRRILNTPPRGIGVQSVEKISSYAKEIQRSFFQASKQNMHIDLPMPCAQAINDLHEQLSKLRKEICQNPQTSAMTLIHFLQALDYKKMIDQSFKNPSMAQKRWEMIESFAHIMQSFLKQGHDIEASMTDFVDAMMLGDSVEDQEQNGVQLMTLHACKGLEFPIVILLGVEEDLLPHRRLGEDIAEERRLFYVGITRAKDRLVLTRSKKRKKFGRVKDSVPSRFLVEVPETLLHTFHSGYRPMGEDHRKKMIEKLYAKLDQMEKNEQ
ncbi:MAG: UvrD-helicase domain-containing protein [Bdellovibrionales bacterium]|nr:UvrD-helicase domain-containing protein [Bdellovibrionales bacterium]